MSTLEGQSINQTYKDLLQVSNSNSGVDGTLRAVEDGEGTVSALEISTTDVRINNLTVTGTVTGLPSSATNLSTTANGTSLTVNSDTGNNASIPAATTSAWGAMTDEDKTKLNGIDTGATANNTDAHLKNRANHTGTQTASTISDFDTEVANNTAVQANTAKVGITTAQANAITANTAKVGITTAQANAITANTAKVTNATHTGDAAGDTVLTLASVNSNVGSFTSANITVDAKGRVTAASNGSAGSGTTYNSGWVSAVGNSVTHTITHGLNLSNSSDIIIHVYYAINSSGVDAEHVNIYRRDYGAFIDNFQTNSFTITLGSTGFGSWSTGGFAPVTWSGKYFKVVVIKI